MLKKYFTKLKEKKQIISGIEWVILWPILIILPAVAGLIGGMLVARVILGNAQDIDKMYITAWQIAVFVSITVLVILSYFLKKFLKNKKRLFWRVGGGVLGVYMWVGMFIGGIVMILVGYPILSLHSLTFTQDPHLLQVLIDIGGDPAKLNNSRIIYNDDYSDDSIESSIAHYMPINDARGFFSDINQIEVRRGLDYETEKLVVAHEYLHLMWNTQINEKDKQELTSQLINVYAQNKFLQDRTRLYSDVNKLTVTELFAYSCTELFNDEFPDSIREQCNKYIKRSLLPIFR